MKKYLSEIIEVIIYICIVLILVASAINYGKAKATLSILEDFQEVYINMLTENPK